MLKLPAFRYFEDATVFQDDAEIHRFYVVPGFPSIRLDENNNPVFLLVKYAFSDQSREENPELGRGGGYLAFDAELTISKDRRDEIAAELQQWVNGEWARLKTLPAAGAHVVSMSASLPSSPVSNLWQGGNVGFTGRDAPQMHGSTVSGTLTLPGHDDWQPPGPDEPAPTVVFGEPLWSAGKVRMNAPTSEGLVSNRVAEQPASLVGDNVAAFSADLTEDGATFMQRTLLEPDGSGGTDLSPLQVTYELTMKARLPPARALIKYDAIQVYREIQELWHEKCTGCGDDYFTSESQLGQAMKAGLVTVKIDTGGITDPETVQLLTEQALTTAREIVVNTFTDAVAKPEGPPEEWADQTGLSEEIAIVMAEEEVYRLKQRSDVSMTNFEQVIEIASTIDFTIAPQGTLQPFFDRFSPDQMKRFVREIDLDDDFFKTLSLSARAFAKWAEDGVAFVEMELLYEHDGERKTQSLTFTAADNEPKIWDPSLIGDEREYQYRTRVAFNGRDAGEWSAWTRSTNRALNVSVETPGKIAMEVIGAGLDFEGVLDAVLVHLRYEDRRGDVPLGGTTLVLTADRQSGTWERLIYAPWTEPVEYAIEYLLKDGSVFRTGWKKTEGPTPRIVAPPPQVDILNIAVVPAGLWTGVIQSVIDLAYEDAGNDYAKDITYQLKTRDEFRQWAVLLRDPQVRRFKYKVLTTFDNGDRHESDWQTRTGDQSIPVVVQAIPHLQVTIVGRVVDYAQTPTVQVTLQHSDPQHGERTKSFTLSKPEDELVWDIVLGTGASNKYRYRLTYFPKDIDPVTIDWATTSDDRLIPPRYDVPRVGARVVATMVDFTATPVVEVDLKYSDPQRGVNVGETLVFTSKEPQTWYVAVADGAPRMYTVTYRYNLADGTVVAEQPKRTDSTALIVPKYKPR